MSKRGKGNGEECTKRKKKRTRQGKVKETIEKSNDALIQKTLSTKIKIIEHNIL
jgi:hypothetical protein